MFEDTVAPLAINGKSTTNGVFSAAAFQYTEEPGTSRIPHQSSEASSSLRRRAHAADMNGPARNMVPPNMWVRALYDYSADD